MTNLHQRKGLRNNVTAVITDGELAAFKAIQHERGGSMASVAREGVLLLLAAHGYQGSTETPNGKKAS